MGRLRSFRGGSVFGAFAFLFVLNFTVISVRRGFPASTTAIVLLAGCAPRVGVWLAAANCCSDTLIVCLFVGGLMPAAAQPFVSP